MIKALVPIAFVFVLATPAAAGAAPSAKGLELPHANVTQVQHRERRRAHRYIAGRRYGRAPRGWRRHGAVRPYDWRTRGCIIVGPIWFCP